jgi:adenosylhomocysteinase
MKYRIANSALAGQGREKLDWAEAHMPVLHALGEKYKSERPLKGLTVAGCVHVTKETGVLIRSLAKAGAEISWAGCNPLSTQDDVAACLAVLEGVGVFASRGVDREQYYKDIGSVADSNPHIVIDDGADLNLEMHRRMLKLADYNGCHVIGGTEETTTGVVRLQAYHKRRGLLYPIMAVNDAETKHDFDNVYGTGQSALDGVIRATNVLISGKTVVVAGYGHVGKGIARRAAGLGANVIVTEIDPIAGLKAAMDGFRLMPMAEAAKEGDVFITATGCKDVITAEHVYHMKRGAILANAGHFNVEINVGWLEHVSPKYKVNDNVMAYNASRNGYVYLISEGRLVNLAAAEGHPSEVMDMSFANQFLSALWIAKHHSSMRPGIHNISKEQDLSIAAEKVASMGLRLDVLTGAQREYVGGFAEGT